MFYLQSKPEQFIMFNGVNITQYMDGGECGGPENINIQILTTKIVL